MFNLLVSAWDSVWESEPMTMDSSRFREYSGEESANISLTEPETLRSLERAQSILMYEIGVEEAYGDIVRIGQMRAIKVQDRVISFRFQETGRLSRAQVIKLAQRLQIAKFELTRTHWSIKDGEIPQDVLREIVATEPHYDVVLSFAGENRSYVQAVANVLESHGVSFFYDQNELVTLWGKDLGEHLDLVYRKLGRYCVMFISKHYAEKMWTSHERKSAFARAIEQRTEYVLPARFDNTEIPGLRPSVGYIDISEMPSEKLAELILRKLGRS